MSRRTLYLGLEVPEGIEGEIVHYPVIRIEPLDLAPCLAKWEKATHLIFTSKTAVRLLSEHVSFKNKQCLAVGKKSAAELPEAIVSPRETAEGMVELLETMDLEKALVLWPHSALSRPVIAPYLEKRGIEFYEFPIYTTVNQKPGPLPDLTKFDLVYFTSPSTVDGFERLFDEIPAGIELRAIGPVTARRLRGDPV